MSLTMNLPSKFLCKPVTGGFSLIEVLVSIVILMIGLLGLAGLQSRAFTAQLESYQRSQALILAQDMASRIEANRKNVAAYLTANPAAGGAGVDVVTPCPGGTVAAQDMCDWHNALLGSAEASVTGAMIGARGCVIQEVAPALGAAGIYQVIVSWQGLNSTFAPNVINPASPGNCGLGLYLDRNGASNEALHRVIAIPVSVADLTP